MGHEPVLIPDFTLFIQIGIFFACYFILRALVFKPYLALLAARRDRTSGLQAAAVEARAKSEKLRTDYEIFMKAERKKIALFAEEGRRKISEEEKAAIQAARGAASKDLQVVRGNLKVDFDNARQKLMPLITEYSSEIASKLVGRKVLVQGVAHESSKDSGAERMVPN